MTGDQRKRPAVWLFPLAVMVLIFWFSSQQGDDSSALSGAVTDFLYGLFRPLFPGMAPADFALALTWPVRKFAHMGEFTLLYLSFLTAFRFGSSMASPAGRTLVSLVSTGLYACSDEFHQLFVPGRAGRAADVAIDLVLPLCLSLILLFFPGKRRARKEGSGECRGI